MKLTAMEEFECLLLDVEEYGFSSDTHLLIAKGFRAIFDKLKQMENRIDEIEYALPVNDLGENI